MTDWIRVCASSDLLPGESTVAWVGDTPVLVCNLDGALHALEDRCSHEDFELSAGTFDTRDGTVECVLHGARFDVRTGEPRCAPAYTAVPRYAARRADDAVWVSTAPVDG